MNRINNDTNNDRSVGRPRLPAALAAARVARVRRPSRSRGCRGVSPCLPGLVERPGPARVASGEDREGRKARGARSAATRAPCTPKLWPANNLCDRAFVTGADRAWTRAGHPLGHVGCRSVPIICEQTVLPDFAEEPISVATHQTCGVPRL